MKGLVKLAETWQERLDALLEDAPNLSSDDCDFVTAFKEWHKEFTDFTQDFKQSYPNSNDQWINNFENETEYTRPLLLLLANCLTENETKGQWKLNPQSSLLLLPKKIDCQTSALNEFWRDLLLVVRESNTQLKFYTPQDAANASAHQAGAILYQSNDSDDFHYEGEPDNTTAIIMPVTPATPPRAQPTSASIRTPGYDAEEPRYPTAEDVSDGDGDTEALTSHDQARLMPQPTTGDSTGVDESASQRGVGRRSTCLIL